MCGGKLALARMLVVSSATFVKSNVPGFSNCVLHMCETPAVKMESLDEIMPLSKSFSDTHTNILSSSYVSYRIMMPFVSRVHKLLYT